MATLRQLRNQRHLTQEQLAVTANVSTSTVYRIAAGKVSPTAAVMQRLAQVLGVSPVEIELPLRLPKQIMVEQPFLDNQAEEELNQLRPVAKIRTVNSTQPATFIVEDEARMDVADRSNVLCWELNNNQPISNILAHMEDIQNRYRDYRESNLPLPCLAVFTNDISQADCFRLGNAGAIVFDRAAQPKSASDAKELETWLKKASYAWVYDEQGFGMHSPAKNVVEAGGIPFIREGESMPSIRQETLEQVKQRLESVSADDYQALINALQDNNWWEMEY